MIELASTIITLGVETLDFCAKLMFFFKVLDSAGISETFLICYSALIFTSSSALFFVARERLKVSKDCYTDLTEGCSVDATPVSGFVKASDYEVKAVRMCRELSMERHAIMMSLIQDMIPLPINLWFMSMNDWSGNGTCINIFGDTTFKMCLCSVLVTSMLIGYKLELIPGLLVKTKEMEQLVALARLRKQRNASSHSRIKEDEKTEAKGTGDRGGGSPRGGRRGGTLEVQHRLQQSFMTPNVEDPSDPTDSEQRRRTAVTYGVGTPASPSPLKSAPADVTIRRGSVEYVASPTTNTRKVAPEP
jgi:hypothetical protein